VGRYKGGGWEKGNREGWGVKEDEKSERREVVGRHGRGVGKEENPEEGERGRNDYLWKYIEYALEQGDRGWVLGRQKVVRNRGSRWATGLAPPGGVGYGGGGGTR